MTFGPGQSGVSLPEHSTFDRVPLEDGKMFYKEMGK
jgi:hypothetical protein